MKTRLIIDWDAYSEWYRQEFDEDINPSDIFKHPFQDDVDSGFTRVQLTESGRHHMWILPTEFILNEEIEE